MKHKFLKFISVFLLLMSSLTAAADTQRTIYATAGIFSSWDDSKNNIKIRVQQGDNDWQPSSDGQSDMTKTAVKRNGKPIYSFTYTDKYGGAKQFQFKKYEGSTYQDNYTASNGNSYWIPYGTSENKVFCGWVSNADSWESLYYVNGGTVYFDNSKTLWPAVQICIGHNTYSKFLKMTKITNTELYYIVLNESWADATYCAFIGETGEWGVPTDNSKNYADRTQNTTKKTATADISITNPLNSGDFYLYTPASNATSTNISRTSGTSYSSVINTYSHTMTQKVKATSDGDYESSSVGGNVNSAAYGLSAASTATSKALSNKAAVAGNITFSQTANTGYDFDGFFVGSTQVTSPYTAQGETTIEARYTAQSYTITYKDQDGAAFSGDNAGDLPSTHTYGTATTLVNASRAGYRFDGWFEDSGCTGSAVTEIGATAKTANFTLYAKWTEDKVYYDVTSGVKSYAGSTEQTAKATLSITATSGEYDDVNNKVLASSLLQFTVSSIATGYEIEGWYSDATCSSEIDGAGTAASYTAPAATGNISVYVKLIATQYSITYTETHSVAHSNPATYNVEDEIPFSDPTTERTGYTFTGWSPVSIAKGTTGNQTVTAQWSPKTYTISFDQNEGTGGQTGTVTATYDAAMPALATPFTAPVKNGYKFLGYEYNGTLYYNADGTSARNWDIDGNTELTAKWDKIHVYIEGRFKVRTSEEGEWKYVAANGTWTKNSTNIEFEFDAVNNKYVLHTYAYFDELAAQISSQTPYFYPASYCASEGNFVQLGATSQNYEFNKTVKSGDATGDKNFVFGTDCHDSSVDLIYDPVNHKLSYESVAEPHYNVTFIEGGQGAVNTPGTQSVGVRGGWNITATPKDAYRFDHWSTTGGAHVADASSASTAVTVDGDGTVTANFVFNRTRVYFQMPQDWIDAKFNTVFVYFYKGTYWDDNKGSGAGGINQTSGTSTSGNCIHYGKMTHTGVGNVYYYDVPYLGNLESFITFTNKEQPGYDVFSETSVACSWELDKTFSRTKMMYVPDNYVTHRFYPGDKETPYYNNGSWQFYSNSPEEYYVQHDHTDPAWTTLSELRFEPTENNNIRKTILRDLTANEPYKFKIWKSTGASFGCNTTITGNVDNYKFYYNDPNCTLRPTYSGNYELTLNVSDMQLSVRYLADFYIRSFPEAVSVVPNGIKRIEPKIDLRDGYDVTKLQVSISGFDNTIATLEQSGYNIIVTGVANGTTTATITYNYNGNEFVYPLTIVVGPAVTIQAKIEGGDGKWIYTNMVNVHYWLSDKTADVNMTYTESGDDKYYTAALPLPAGQTTFSMMFWYGENIDMSASDVWRKTGNIENLDIYTDGTKTQTQSYCFTIKHTAGDDKQRDEEHATGLCIKADAIYQVEVTMKNGKMYTSNVVSQNGDEVSFFAPNTYATDYTLGTIRLMKNGAEVMQTIENATPGIYTATLNIPAEGNATLSALTAYPGPFYVLSGLSGTEVDATTGKNAMNQFTPRANTNEDYSFYWTAYTNSAAYKDNKNTIATVANEWNKNLSLTIGSDKKTASDGTVEAGNVRFSYEPTTNEFKRAIIGGSTENPKFLAIVGNNVYDVDGTTLLDDAQYALPDTKCKFTDASDWVYEKNIKIMADGENDANVYIKAQFNGVLTELLGYEIDSETGEETTTPKPLTVMGKSTTPGTYDIRIIYDYKKNRLLSAWEPQEQTINTDKTIESDVMFISQEDGDVKQVTIGDVTEGTPAKLTSLQNVMYVKEFLQSGTQKTYWMSLPFDCRISDIYGIGGYGTVWRIQEYDGKTRAEKGWLNESQTFWRTMTMDDEMKAGYGYLLQIVRTKMEFHEIDGKAALRLYFPSKEKGFTMTRSAVDETKEYDVENCTIKGREAEDSNWKLMGPLAYNNIEVKTVVWDDQASKPEDVTRFPSYIYEYDAENKTYNVVSAENRTYHSFHAFMTQFGGTIEWQPYTETTKPGQAPRFADLSNTFNGGRLTIELVQSEETLDRTFVTLSQYGTEGFDQNKDLTKIAESRSTISTITNNVEYAGNTLPLDIEMVPLNVKVVADGTYDIALEQSLEGLEVRLYDAFEQTTTPLDLMSATVTLNKGEYKDRFFLQFVQKSPLTPTNFNGTIEQFNLPSDKTQKLLINDNIYLINAGRIYNASGTKVR